MQRVPGLYVADTGDKGRGVYTTQDIHSGDLIEICPVIIIPATELPIIHKTVLHDYYFIWGEDPPSCAIALGFGSLYNHEIFPNAEFILDFDNLTIDILAIRDIAAGEEISINYHGASGEEGILWF